MSFRLRFFALVAALFTPLVGGPRIEYFSNVREVHPISAKAQNFIVIDREIWDHARRDLGDLRLYDPNGEVPYALRAQQVSNGTDQISVRILNLGKTGAATEFIVDASDSGEYDTIILKLTARDFVTQAAVSGSDDLHATGWTRLSSGTLFDFTREKLGDNFALHVPPSRFRYLRIQIASSVRPQDVAGATIAQHQEHQALWSTVPAWNAVREVKARNSVFTLETSPRIPVERIQFTIASGTDNFRRDVELRDADGNLLASGYITRLHLQRGANKADRELLAVDVTGSATSSRYEVTVRNGDDRPLPIEEVRLLSLERRLYFTPASLSTLKLYYGDELLAAPTYDYAKLFSLDDAAVPATLSSAQHNPAYTGRPDGRPWTERHKWVLWAALVLVVVGLGGIALRSLRAPA